MAEHEITMDFSNAGTRNEVRMRVVAALAKEIPGKGRDDLASRYTYFVEKISDGTRVFLRRPANLHNGFDFVVRVENVNFAPNGKRFRDAPSHEDIIHDLKLKRKEDAVEYKKLHVILKSVFECKEVSVANVRRIRLTKGLNVELLVKVLKWLFIEQDIRYWNYSGREMLWAGLPRP